MKTAEYCKGTGGPLILATIEDNTKLQLSILQKQIKDTKFEMNPGGHFANPMQRLAKGIAWLMS